MRKSFFIFSQLYQLTSLFSSVDIGDHISPLAFGMSIDKVADVRHAAINAVRLTKFDRMKEKFRLFQLSGCYSKFHSENAENQMEIFLDDSHRIFASSTDWKLRQAYVTLCQSIYELHQDTPDQYALRFLPKLLLLKEDPVVNVRLSLGTFIYQHLVNNGNFKKKTKIVSLKRIRSMIFLSFCRILFWFIR